MFAGRNHILAPGLVFAALAGGTMPVIGLSEFLGGRFGMPPEKAGLFISVGLFAGFVFAPIAGWVSDGLLSRRFTVAAGALVNALCWWAIAFAPDFEWALGLRLLEGISSAFVVGPLLAMGGEAERENGGRVGSVLGPMGMLLLLGVAAGILLGGVLSSEVGIRVPFFTSGSVLLFVAVLVFLTREAYSGAKHSRSVEIEAGTSAGKSTLMVLVALLCLAFADRFAAGFLMGGFLIHLKGDSGYTAGQAGALLSLVSFPMALGAVPAVLLARRWGLSLVVGMGSAAFGLLLPLMTLETRVLPLIALLGFSGLSAALMYAPSLVLLERKAPAHRRGMFLGAFYGLGSLGYALGPVLSTQLTDWFASFARVETSLVFTAGVFGLCELLPGLVLLGLALRARFRAEAPPELGAKIASR